MFAHAGKLNFHSFYGYKKLPLFFLLELISHMGEINFTIGPIPKNYLVVL